MNDRKISNVLENVWNAYSPKYVPVDEFDNIYLAQTQYSPSSSDSIEDSICKFDFVCNATKDLAQFEKHSAQDDIVVLEITEKINQLNKSFAVMEETSSIWGQPDIIQPNTIHWQDTNLRTSELFTLEPENTSTECNFEFHDPIDVLNSTTAGELKHAFLNENNEILPDVLHDTCSTISTQNTTDIDVSDSTQVTSLTGISSELCKEEFKQMKECEHQIIPSCQLENTPIDSTVGLENKIDEPELKFSNPVEQIGQNEIKVTSITEKSISPLSVYDTFTSTPRETFPTDDMITPVNITSTPREISPTDDTSIPVTSASRETLVTKDVTIPVNINSNSKGSLPTGDLTVPIDIITIPKEPLLTEDVTTPVNVSPTLIDTPKAPTSNIIGNIDNLEALSDSKSSLSKSPDTNTCEHYTTDIAEPTVCDLKVTLQSNSNDISQSDLNEIDIDTQLSNNNGAEPIDTGMIEPALYDVVSESNIPDKVEDEAITTETIESSDVYDFNENILTNVQLLNNYKDESMVTKVTETFVSNANKNIVFDSKLSNNNEVEPITTEVIELALCDANEDIIIDSELSRNDEIKPISDAKVESTIYDINEKDDTDSKLSHNDNVEPITTEVIELALCDSNEDIIIDSKLPHNDEVEQVANEELEPFLNENIVMDSMLLPKDEQILRNDEQNTNSIMISTVLDLKVSATHSNFIEPIVTEVIERPVCDANEDMVFDSTASHEVEQIEHSERKLTESSQQSNTDVQRPTLDNCETVECDLNESSYSIIENDLSPRTEEVKIASISTQITPRNLEKKPYNSTLNNEKSEEKNWHFNSDYGLTRTSKCLIESIEDDIDFETSEKIDPEQPMQDPFVVDIASIKKSLTPVVLRKQYRQNKKDSRQITKRYQSESSLILNVKHPEDYRRSRSLQNVTNDFETDIDEVDDLDLLDILQRYVAIYFIQFL